MLSRPPNTVELSNYWVSNILKYQGSSFYNILFDVSEERLFEVPSGRKRVDVIIKPLPGAPKLYSLQDTKVSCVFLFL